jgi:hypothetical protein
MKPAYFLVIAVIIFSTCKKKDDPAPSGPDSSKMITVEIWDDYPNTKLSGVTVVLTRETTDTIIFKSDLKGDTIYTGVSDVHGKVVFESKRVVHVEVSVLQL